MTADGGEKDKPLKGVSAWRGLFRFPRAPLGKAFLVLAIVLSFAVGYGSVTTHYNTCFAVDLPDTDAPDAPEITSATCAGFSATMGCIGPQCTGPQMGACLAGSLCVFTGQTALLSLAIYAAFESKIKKMAKKMEKFTRDLIDAMVMAGLKRIDLTEDRMISWWDTMWGYALYPSMQAQTEQINAATVDQAKDFMQSIDAAETAETIAAVQDSEAADATEITVDENGCPTATVSGGMGRATVFGNAMRNAWQNEALRVMSNRVGSPGARGKAAYLKYKSGIYENLFCDPADNAGNNVCGINADDEEKFYNADTRVTKFIHNMLTIPVDGTNADQDKYAYAVSQGIENLMGTPSADPIPPSAMDSPEGQEKWLDRRAFMAKYAAVRAVPQWIAGERMPGGGGTGDAGERTMAEWVREIRKDAGLPENQLSKNPSFREMIHALTIDRFNNGKYAFEAIGDPAAVEMEKLRQATFQLMLLRSYYELLERSALSLSVQVAVMADQIPLPDVSKLRKVR